MAGSSGSGASSGNRGVWIAFAGVILAAIIGGIFLLFTHDSGLTQNGDGNKGCLHVQNCNQK